MARNPLKVERFISVTRFDRKKYGKVGAFTAATDILKRFYREALDCELEGEDIHAHIFLTFSRRPYTQFPEDDKA